MDPLSFKLKIKVPETHIVNSLINLVYERVKRINEILTEARSLEISLFQRLVDEEKHAVAEITLAHDTLVINESSESKVWDDAFLNALDKVKAKLETSLDKVLV
jgi:ribosome-associated translation inhibitor RaiA